MPASAVKQIWPPFIAGPARKWVIEHVVGGRVASGDFQAALPGGLRLVFDTTDTIPASGAAATAVDPSVWLNPQKMASILLQRLKIVFKVYFLQHVNPRVSVTSQQGSYHCSLFVNGIIYR